MPDPTRAQDRDRLADAAYVLHGEAGSGTIRRLLYALYLVLIFGGVYGFNLLRAMLVTADQGWVDSLASGWGVLALLATVLVAGIALGGRAGIGTVLFALGVGHAMSWSFTAFSTMDRRARDTTAQAVSG